MSDAETVLEMVIARAQARLDGQMRDGDALDVKALGVLAADVAALGVLIAVHTAINRFWWIPALSLGVAGFLLLVAVWPRELDVGPNWRIFYETWGGSTPVDTGRQMLSELLDAIERNERESRKPHGKNLVFKVGLLLMVISLIGSAVAGYVR